MWKSAKAAIFDMDGTLIDSMGVWQQIDRQFLHRRGFDLPQDYMEAVKVLDYAKAADYTVKRFGLNESPQDIMDEWHAMAVDAYSHHILLKPGAKELLQSMLSHGLKVGLATASAKGLYQPVLKSNRVYDCFHAFCTTSEAGKGKGHPEVYLLCAQRLGVAPKDCIVFEDVLAGIRGAKAAGMRAVGVYDSHSAYESDQIRALADGYVDSLEQLIECQPLQSNTKNEWSGR